MKNLINISLPSNGWLLERCKSPFGGFSNSFAANELDPAKEMTFCPVSLLKHDVLTGQRPQNTT